MSNNHGKGGRCYCGFKIRGSNHENGAHHGQKRPKGRKLAKAQK